MPDRPMLERHLILVQGHVDKGVETLNRHYALMERLAVGGRDLTSAERHLEMLLNAQAMHIEHRDRLRRELGLPELR